MAVICIKLLKIIVVSPAHGWYGGGKWKMTTFCNTSCSIVFYDSSLYHVPFYDFYDRISITLSNTAFLTGEDCKYDEEYGHSLTTTSYFSELSDTCSCFSRSRIPNV